MNFLDDLLAAWGNGQTPFAQDQMQTMQGGGMPIPDFVNAPAPGLPSMVGSMPRTPMPLQKPMLAGSGNSEGMSRRPPAAVVSGPEPVSADLAAPSFATTLSGALQGASEATGPLGALLGGIGGAIGANDAVTEKNQTFRLLKQRGLSDADAALAVKNPQYMQQLLTVLARKEAPMSEADQLELEKSRLEIEALKRARPSLVKDAPEGTMWVDPNDQSKGVKPIPGYDKNSKGGPTEFAQREQALKTYNIDPKSPEGQFYLFNGKLPSKVYDNEAQINKKTSSAPRIAAGLETLRAMTDSINDASFNNSLGPVQGSTPDNLIGKGVVNASRLYGEIGNWFEGGNQTPNQVRNNITGATEALAAAIKPLIRGPGEGVWTDADQARLVSIVGDLAQSSSKEEFKQRLNAVRDRVSSNFGLDIPFDAMSDKPAAGGGGWSMERLP